MANLSLNEIKTILKAELEKYVLESNEDMLKINPYSKKEVEEEIEFTKTLKNLYRLGLESGDEKLNRIIDKRLEMIFEKNSIEMDTKSVDYRMLRMNFVKALEKQFEYKMELLSGEQQSVYDISDSIHDEVTSPHIESIASPPGNIDFKLMMKLGSVMHWKHLLKKRIRQVHSKKKLKILTDNILNCL